MYRNIEKIVQRSHIPPSPCPPGMNSFTVVWYSCYNQWTNIKTLLTEVHAWFRFPSFLTWCRSSPGYHPRRQITFSCHVSLGSLCLRHFLRLCLSLMTLMTLRKPVKYIAGWPFIGICLMFFLQWHWGYELGGGRSQRKSAISFTSHQGDILSTWFMTVHDDQDHLAKVVFARFLYHKVTFIFFPLSTLCSLEGSHYTQSTLKE